jgi:hypothetical protein
MNSILSLKDQCSLYKEEIMNSDQRLFRNTRKQLELELGLCKAWLNRLHFVALNDVMVIRQRWLIRQFRTLVKAGQRWEAEQRFLWGIDRLRREAFDRIVEDKIIKAKIHDICRGPGSHEGLCKVDETGIRQETAIEFYHALREITGPQPVPVG